LIRKNNQVIITSAANLDDNLQCLEFSVAVTATSKGNSLWSWLSLSETGQNGNSFTGVGIGEGEPARFYRMMVRWISQRRTHQVNNTKECKLTDYRRVKVNGGIYFFIENLLNRNPLLLTS